MAVAKTLSKSKKLKPTSGKSASGKASTVAKSARQALRPKGKIQNQSAPKQAVQNQSAKSKAKGGKFVQPSPKAAPSKGGKLASTIKSIFSSASSAVSAPTAKAAKGKPAAPAGKPAAKAASTPVKSPAPTAKAKNTAAPTPAAPAKAAKVPAGKAAPAVAQSQKPAKTAGVASPAAGAVVNRKPAVKRAVGRAGASPTAHGAALEGVCREVACENLATTGGYCRLHYIKNWKKIKRKEAILKEGRLNQYIEELVSKYPDKYIEAIRQDLASVKDFLKVISDLDLDEGSDEFEGEGGEQVEGIIDNIRREFEDEGETF